MASKFENRLKRRNEWDVNGEKARQCLKFRKPLCAGALLRASRIVYLAAFAKG